MPILDPPRSRPGFEAQAKVLFSLAEARILLLAATGEPTWQIASRLGVSHQAVTYHLGNLMRKLGVENRVALVAKAYAEGLFPGREWPPTYLGGVTIAGGDATPEGSDHG